MTVSEVYPNSPVDRSRWVVEKRGTKNSVSNDRAYAQFLEQEPSGDGVIATVATIFLTNRECPWKCVMCDLWRNTTPAKAGSVPSQIERALEMLPHARQATVLKLYNSGSFFDNGAIPKSDWTNIARLCNRFDQVIVECHPKLVGDSVLKFADLLRGSLEIALGLETAHPGALEKINKRITVEDFQRAVTFLRSNDISVRTFLLVGVPFIDSQDQAKWLQNSIQCALSAGTDVVSLIPTRAGNGALDRLAQIGLFREPVLTDLEDAQDYGLSLGSGRVFADTWDLDRFIQCRNCGAARVDRIATINLLQRPILRVECSCAK